MGWMKNTGGKKSVTLTMLLVAFVPIVGHMALAIFVKPFGIEVTPFDGANAMMLLAPLLAAYSARRHTESNEDIEMKKMSPDSQEGA